MRKIRIIYVVCSLAVTVCCTNDPVVLQPESLGLYYLECRIAPESHQTGAILQFLNPEAMPTDVEGAKVTIAGGGQQMSFLEIKPGVYKNNGNLLTIKPAVEYYLTATLSDGFVLSARTMVPGHFKMLINPTDTLEYMVKTVGLGHSLNIFIPPKISWTKSQHALSYTLQLKTTKSTVDTTVFLPEIGMTDYFGENPEATVFVEKAAITITAHDSSYLPYQNSYDYYHANWKDPYGENFKIDQIGLQFGLMPGYNDNIIGGTGNFSGSYTISDSVIIRYKRESHTE